MSAAPRVAAVALLLLSLAFVPLPAGPAAAQEEAGHEVTGQLRLLVDPDEPVLRLSADWAWFPREDYPWENIETGRENAPEIHPSLLTGYVNYGCHFEGWVEWEYEEGEVEVLESGWVRRRLNVTRKEQGGFYNNQLRFKCELATRNKKVNQLIGTLVTMGELPNAFFASSLAQVAYMRAIQAINTLDLQEGSFGAFLYNTFKSILTLNAIDDNQAEIDLYFSPEGDRLEFEVHDQRWVVFTR